MNQEVLTLRKDSSELQEVLLAGEVFRHGEKWTGIPREIIWTGGTHENLESVVFEIFHPRSVRRPHLIKVLWQAIRPERLSLPLAPCASVLAYGIYSGWELSWTQALLSILGVLFFQVSVNVYNDVEDHLRLIDLPRSLRGDGVLQKGWINAKRLRRLASISLLLGILCGLPAVFYGPGMLLWIAGAATLGVLAHSNRPFSMKYRRFGDLIIFILLGPFLSLGYSQAVFDQVDGMSWALGLLFGFLAWASFLAKQLQSFEVDRSRNLSSLARFLGFNRSRHLLAGFYFFGYSILWVLLGTAIGQSFTFFEALFLLGVTGVSLFWIIPLMEQVYRASGPNSALLTPIRERALRIHLLAGVGFCLALAVLKFLK